MVMMRMVAGIALTRFMIGVYLSSLVFVYLHISVFVYLCFCLFVEDGEEEEERNGWRRWLG